MKKMGTREFEGGGQGHLPWPKPKPRCPPADPPATCTPPTFKWQGVVVCAIPVCVARVGVCWGREVLFLCASVCPVPPARAAAGRQHRRRSSPPLFCCLRSISPRAHLPNLQPTLKNVAAHGWAAWVWGGQSLPEVCVAFFLSVSWLFFFFRFWDGKG